VKTKCSNCGAQFIVAEEYKGKTVKCKKCQKTFQITEINVSQGPVQETNKDLDSDKAIKKDISPINEAQQKVSAVDSNNNAKVKKIKTKTIVGFLALIILIAIFVPPIIWPHPLKNKTIGEITKMVQVWQLKGTWPVDEFYKEFGKPKKKLLIGDEYYFYYDCKDGLVSLKIGKYALERDNLVNIRDVSLD
jgi:predicted Zn finger-like uncharacterized protein